VSREDKQGIYRYLCAYFVSEHELSASRLRKYLSTSLPDYMIPSYFVQIDKIPLTPNGKLDRKALPVPGVEASQKYLAPGDELEEKLVEIWSEVLGRDKFHGTIGIDDNFFEIGGHSLKATIMVSMIRREWNVNVPLVEVFKSPTIRGLAQYIKLDRNEIDITAKPAPDDHIVLLKSADNSSGHLFFIHDGSGEVEGYIGFCNHLDHLFNCWGIRADGLGNYAPGNLSITEIAKNYIEKVKKVQPRGPYRIAAWSLGGTIAFEIVRQLEQIKETVAFFAMIDVPPPPGNGMPREKFTRESELKWIRECLSGSDMIGKLQDTRTVENIWISVVDYIRSNNIDARVFRGIINQFAGASIPNYHRLEPPELIRYLNIIRSLDAARLSYVPNGKINTPIYFFKASRSGSIKHENWSEYACKPLKFYEVTGDHYSIFKSPGVIDFAEKFGKTLEGSSVTPTGD
jgi:thioesterase domain-containing protein/acyl carrier protein